MPRSAPPKPVKAKPVKAKAAKETPTKAKVANVTKAGPTKAKPAPPLAKPSKKPAATTTPVMKAPAKKKAPEKPAKKASAPAPAPAPSLAATVDEHGVAWVAAPKGYALALVDGKLVAKNDKGKPLASVPKELASSELGEQLLGLRDWLKAHDAECLATVDTWMLRSLPVPRAVIESVWPDHSWRAPLENAVVVAVTDEGLDLSQVGFLRGADAAKGVGIVNLDGETAWLKSPEIAVPHPILLPELAELRQLASELKLEQGLPQLFRETHPKPASIEAKATTLSSFANGKFAQLVHALGKAKSLGYPVRGGFACCPVYEDGVRVEARYWVGADAPDAETYTGDLLWVDGREKPVPLGEVGPVAYSEGVRMASALYAARVVEKQEEVA